VQIWVCGREIISVCGGQRTEGLRDKSCGGVAGMWLGIRRAEEGKT
jgi:hypothetical protein